MGLKVIITLNRELAASPEERLVVGRRIQEEFGIRHVSPGVLATLGVVSGEIDPECLPDLRRRPEVKSVERAGLKRAQ